MILQFFQMILTLSASRNRLLMLLAVLVTACSSNDTKTVPGEQLPGAGIPAQVEDQVGVYNDSYLRNYMDAVGRRLVAGAAPTPYQFSFQIVDQAGPNVVATPDGAVYVSRGLLALINSEAELAGILAHEISHVLLGHRAGLLPGDAASERLVLPDSAISAMFNRDVTRIINTSVAAAGTLAAGSFTQAQEAEADAAGLRLAARAGYDPLALGSALSTLQGVLDAPDTPVTIGGFFDRHPSAPDRLSMIAGAGAVLEWQPSRPFASDKAAVYKRLDGMDWGPGNPQQGVFYGQQFLQPDMDFSVTFPDGWRTVNTPRFVGAFETSRRAAMLLTSPGPLAPPERYAQAFAADLKKATGRVPDEIRPVDLGEWPAWLLHIRDGSGSATANYYYVWVRSDRTMFQILAAGLDEHDQLMREAALSLGQITAEERSELQSQRISAVRAQAGETLADLGLRTGNSWDPSFTSIINGLPVGARFVGDEPVKILRSETYR